MSPRASDRGTAAVRPVPPILAPAALLGARMRRRAGVASGLVLLASMVAACGSTVETGGSHAVDSGVVGDGTGTSIPSAVATPGTGTPGAAVPTSGPGVVPSTSSTGGGGTGGTVTEVVPSGLLGGVGVDAKHVYVGIPTVRDFNTAVGSLGINSFDIGNPESDVNAIVSYLNEHGGVLGRTLVPAFHDTKTADLASDRPAAVEAMCNYYKSDRPVAAVVDMVIGYPDTWDCWRAKHIPFFGQATFIDQTTFDGMYPYMYALNVNRTDSYLPVLLDRQQALGYFAPWDTLSGKPGTEPVKVGILYEESSAGDQRIVAQLKRELQARHIPVAAEFAAKGGDLSQVPAQVLKFKSAGVTHVYIYYELEALLFMKQAENQHYRPRYAAWMGIGPRLMQHNVAPEQLAGALGATWNPDLSVDGGQNPGDTSSAGPLCRQMLREGGVVYERYSNAEMVAFSYCDAIRLIAQAVGAAGGTDPTRLRQAVDAAVAQSRFASSLAFRTAFSLTRSDESGAVRDLGFDPGCSCFRYLSTTNHAS